MKKVIELENRWRAYKYRTTMFYVFVAVLVAFIIMLGVFIKFQIYDKGALVKKRTDSVNLTQRATTKTANPANLATNRNADSAQNGAKVSFTCRQVTANRLNVRQEPNFRSKALGHYVRDSIFCANSEAVNGLLKTPNGWVSANSNYSRIIDTNMFVDSGFHKYNGDSRFIAQNNVPRTSFEEVRVFDKPNRSSNFVESTPKVAPKPKSKIAINITSQKLSKEKMIEFKEADFRNTNDYNTAIEVAKFYYDTKDYDKSIKWALDASNADSKGKQKTESFIIYAKSLYLSGKQDQALEVLSRYISSTNAPDAIDALNKMKQGII